MHASQSLSAMLEVHGPSKRYGEVLAPEGLTIRVDVGQCLGRR